MGKPIDTTRLAASPPSMSVGNRGDEILLPELLEGVTASTNAVLDRIHRDIEAQPSDVKAAMTRLQIQLGELKRNLSAEQWQEAVAICRSHPLRELLHQDPLTARAFSMSRGYQGDAELLDIIYSEDYRAFSVSPATPLGALIFSYTIACKAPGAVRERRNYLAAQIDALCAASPSAHILSVACGHLRELEVAHSIQAASFGRFVGLDQDPTTISVVAKQWQALGVECRLESVKKFLASSLSERFDLIYAAGLYDYLEEQIAQYVTQRLFNMLRPGGRLLIGNYTPGNDEIGYMEAFMGWRLIYRDAQAMQRLAAAIPKEMIDDIATVSDSGGIVVYLDIRAK